MKTDELLNKYFEGETSCEEERELRRFFTEEAVPEHLQMYRPLFAYLNQEVKAAQVEKLEEKKLPRKSFSAHRAYYIFGGIAATLLLLVGISKIIFPLSGTPENYVIIDGKRYTDAQLVEAKALEALQNVSFTDKDLNNLLFQHLNRK